MTKQRDIIAAINRAARLRGLSFIKKSRKGGNHDIYDLDGLMVVIPRHREINELTTKSIYKQAEEKLGKGWWR